MKTREQWQAIKAKAERKLKELDTKPVDGFYFWNGDPLYLGFYNGKRFDFGINTHGDWFKANISDISHINDTFKLATPEEVTQRLTKFVNGRGYVKGVKIRAVYGSMEFTLNHAPLTFSSDSNIYEICLGNWVIWSSIKGWAKIIEAPKYKVEVTRVEKSGTITIEIQHSKEADPNDLAKEIEIFLNSKPC